MTDQIRFAQFVLADIEVNGFRYGKAFYMEGPCYVDTHRVLNKFGHSRMASGDLHKDAWNLHVGWFHVSLIRQDKYLIKLTKEEKEAFRIIERDRKIDVYLNKQDARWSRILAEEAAQTWP